MSEGRRYHVREVLGSGGFGTVYRAELATDGGFVREVALKVLHDGGGPRAGDRLARLRDEARVLGLVRHPALVRVDALVRLGGRWSVVMERVDGVSAERVVDRAGPLPPSVVATFGGRVASALAAAWDTEVDGRPLRLVHRDVKPSNLQLTPTGEVKLLDFGIARAEFDAREARTEDVVYGSRCYMAPERLELDDGPASDVFALGLTLAELASGRAPGGVTGRPDAHAERVESLLAAVGDHAPGLVATLRRALAYAPADRPTAAALERELAALELPGPAPSEWAPRVIGPLAGALRGAAGDLTGQVLTEGVADVTPPPVSRAGGEVGTSSDTFALTDAIGSAPAPAPAAPPAAPSPPPRALWVIAGLGAATFVAVVAVGGVALVFGGLLVAAWPGIALGGCTSEVQVARQELAGVGGEGLPRALAALDALERSCARGESGVFDVAALETNLDAAAADGSISATEADDAEALLHTLTGP